MTFRAFIDLVRTTFPDATVGEESDGHLVVFTGWRVTEQDWVVTMDGDEI